MEDIALYFVLHYPERTCPTTPHRDIFFPTIPLGETEIATLPPLWRMIKPLTYLQHHYTVRKEILIRHPLYKHPQP